MKSANEKKEKKEEIDLLAAKILKMKFMEGASRDKIRKLYIKYDELIKKYQKNS
tara:strand:- start:47 stop:208 length:162 start_codon:yes stop_codon:yes gene_type:complete